MKIALVHDHLAQDGGAENVLRAFCDIWPDAPVYVTVYNPKNAHPYFLQKDVRTSFLQRTPFGLRKYQWFFPLMPAAVESFDLSEFDVVLSSSSSFAKGVVTRPDTMHVTYCHTPTRFLWSDTHSYVSELDTPWITKKIIPPLLSQVRLWDRIAAERSDYYITNSHIVQKRIQKYYDRESTVIYPPVSTADFSFDRQSTRSGEYFLAGGRIVPYKRFDILVEAFTKLGRPLKIFGSGPALKELQKSAPSHVEFLGRVSDEELKELYANAIAFINPQEEDFGITMIEAMAMGCPVIAYKKGGAKEIIEDGVTGMFVEYQTWEDFADAIIHFDPKKYNALLIREKSLTFDTEQFKKNIETYIRSAYEQFTL